MFYKFKTDNSTVQVTGFWNFVIQFMRYKLRFFKGKVHCRIWGHDYYNAGLYQTKCHVCKKDW